MPAGARHEYSVARRIDVQSTRTPKVVALETDGVEYTYAELRSWVEATSQRLLHAGARPGRLVAVALPRSPALVTSLAAINRAGAAFLPIDPGLPRERVRSMLLRAQPEVVLHGDATVWIADLVPADSALHVTDRPDGRRPCTPSAEPAVQARTPAYLVCAPGTATATVVDRATLDDLLDRQLDELCPAPGRRIAQVSAIGPDSAVQEIFPALVSGATLVIPDELTRDDPRRLASWLERRRITDLLCSDSVLEAVCETALARGLTLPDLMHLLREAERPGAATREFRRLSPGRRLHNRDPRMADVHPFSLPNGRTTAARR